VRAPVRIVGSFLSPYVRKVLVVLRVKGVPYEVDPIVPFFGDDRFSQISPLRRVPVLIDEQATLSDSSVICEYLEDRYPEPALRPADIVLRARARWLEEFADSRMGEVFIWQLFNQLAIGPAVFGRPPAPAALEKTLNVDVPHVLEYLEQEIPAAGFVCGVLSVAHISIASFFRNAQFVRFQVDAARWPRTAAFVERVLAHEAFAELRPIEERLLRVPPTQHRTVLQNSGVALTAETYGTETPRPGMMRID